MNIRILLISYFGVLSIHSTGVSGLRKTRKVHGQGRNPQAGIQSPSGDYDIQQELFPTSYSNGQGKGNGHGNNGRGGGGGNKNKGGNDGLQGFVLATESDNSNTPADCANPNGPGNGHGRGHAYGHCRGRGNNKFGPKPPPPGLYKRFAAIYNNVERKVDGAAYDEALENDEVNDDFNGRSIVAPGQYPHMVGKIQNLFVI